MNTGSSLSKVHTSSCAQKLEVMRTGTWWEFVTLWLAIFGEHYIIFHHVFSLLCSMHYSRICDIFQEHKWGHRPDAPLFLYRTMKWPLFLVSLNTLWILIAINLIWQDYLDLANLYTSRNIVDLKRSLTTHEDVFKTVSFDLSFNILSVHHCLLMRW